MAITTKNPSATPYAEFLKSVQPVTISLNSCSAKVNRPVIWATTEKPPADVNARYVLEAKYRLERFTSSSFDVVASLSIQVRFGTETALAVESELSAHFHYDAQGGKELAKKFTDSEARLILWPYFREFVSTTTSRMAVPPLFLPLTFRSPAGEEHPAMEVGATAEDKTAASGSFRPRKRGRRTK